MHRNLELQSTIGSRGANLLPALGDAAQILDSLALDVVGGPRIHAGEGQQARK